MKHTRLSARHGRVTWDKHYPPAADGHPAVIEAGHLNHLIPLDIFGCFYGVELVQEIIFFEKIRFLFLFKM